MATTSKSPSKKTEEVVKLAESLISYGRKVRDLSGVITRYEKSVRYLNGIHEISNREKSKGNKVFNKYGEIFENKTAHTVSKRPRWKFRPQAEDDLIGADVINQVLGDVFFDIDRWDEKGEESMMECQHAGSNIIKTGVTDDGWATFEPLKTRSVLVDKAENHNEIRFIIHLFEMSVEDIKNDFGVDVMPEASLEYGTQESGTFHHPELTYQYTDGSNKAENVWAKTAFGSTFDKSKWMERLVGQATVGEIWMEDKSMEPIPFKEAEVEEEHADFQQFQYHSVQPQENHPKHIMYHQAYLQTLDAEIDMVQIKVLMDHLAEHEQYPQAEKRRKYLRGRVIGVCQGKLLYDKPNSLPVDWRDVFIKYDYMSSGSYWGKCLGNDLWDVQDSINHRKNSIKQNIDLLNNGIKKMAVSAYNRLKDQLHKFNNMIGIIVPVRHKDDFTVDFGKELPSQYFNDLYHDEQFMDRQAGNSDVMAGQLPGSDTAGVTVQQLLQQSSKRINLPVIHYARALEKMARNAIAIMSRTLPGSTVFRILGQDGKYVNMDWGQIRQNLTPLDIRIDIEAFTATSRQEKLMEASRMYEIGVYDRQAVLERMDDPDKWNVLQRTSEIQLLKMQNQAMLDELDIKEKEINSLHNAAQGSSKEENAGKTKTSD